ncbi:hypothetical protein MHYP_G00135930 [Metynnis hypsauchen]
MDLHPSEEPSGPARGSGSLAELGTFFVDSDVIFGFTRHLLRRKAKVEGCSSAESSCSPEGSPKKRRNSAEEERCSPRPPPEGAGSEREPTKTHLCTHCHIVVSELKRQALALTDSASLKVSLQCLEITFLSAWSINQPPV